jgi:hypothetical protein
MKHLLISQSQFVRGWMTSSMIDGLGEVDPFHGLHSHLIYRRWTFYYLEYIRTNIYKTRIKHLNDLKTRINQQIQSIEKKTSVQCFS